MNSATYNEFREPSRSGLGVGSNRFTLPRQALFNSLLVWYWALLYFQSHTAVVERFSPLYFALILPVVAFVVMNAHHVVSWRCDRVIAPLLFYIALVGGVSLLRADIATAYNSALFTLLIILIFRQKLRISLGLLNGLFLLSIAGAVITYWAGISEFGFLPGQSEMGADRGLEWRVSLFPVIPESAFFSLLVLFANWLHGHSRSRIAICALALYFLVLSGNRTSLIAAVMMVVVLAASRWVPFRRRVFYKVMFVALVMAFILIVSLDALLMAVAIENPYLATYVFRTDRELLNSEELARTVYRSWLWQQHLQIFADSPLVGVGTFFLPELLTEQLIENSVDTGSESLLTGLLARIGLLIVPLAIFFVRLCGLTMERGDRLGFCLCLALLVYSLGYGSFLVPYNFLFLLTFAAMNGVQGSHRRPEQPGPA